MLKHTGRPTNTDWIELPVTYCPSSAPKSPKVLIKVNFASIRCRAATMCTLIKIYYTCALQHCQTRYLHKIDYSPCQEVINLSLHIGQCRQGLFQLRDADDFDENMMCSYCVEDQTRLLDENERRQRLYDEHIAKYGQPYRRNSFS